MNINNYKQNPHKIIRDLLLAASGIIIWMLAVYYNQLIAGNYGTVSVRYDEPVLTGNRLEDIIGAMKENETVDIPEVTLWQKTSGVTINNTELNTAAQADLVVAAGDMSAVYPGEFIQGGYIYLNDFEGCIIDSATAYELFHTEAALGMQVKYLDKEYTVRGILKLKNCKTMLINEDDRLKAEDDGYKYSCLELKYSDTENALTLAKDFVLQHDLGSPSAYINGYLYQRLADRIVLFPAWFFAVWLLIICVKYVYSLKNSPFLFLTGIIITAISGAVLIKLTDLHIYFPSALIPDKWSDFDFWLNKWKEIKASLLERENILRYYKDYMLDRYFLYVLASSVYSVIAEAVILKSLNLLPYNMPRTFDVKSII